VVADSCDLKSFKLVFRFVFSFRPTVSTVGIYMCLSVLLLLLINILLLTASLFINGILLVLLLEVVNRYYDIFSNLCIDFGEKRIRFCYFT
jgi:hypothetical protein